MNETPLWSKILLMILVLAVVGTALYYLAGVLIPFAVAWLLAYMLNPVVNFFQHTCRLRFRLVAVLLTLALALGLLVGLFLLIVPPLLEECTHFEVVVRRYNSYRNQNATIPVVVREFIDSNVNWSEWIGNDLLDTLKGLVPKMFSLVYSTASAIFSLVASLISVLYLFFLMMDYNHYARIWITFVPRKAQPFARMLVSDIERYVCGYFRGQFFIALSNCVMFTLGLWLINFPMPFALGCFIGIISFVPYLQVAGLLPATILALLRAADTGQNFWLLILGVCMVYLVVQIIQDVWVTPRIMGRIMGLSPAVILLSLSVGGSLLGVTGLILALPVTTMGLLYYRRYVINPVRPWMK